MTRGALALVLGVLAAPLEGQALIVGPIDFYGVRRVDLPSLRAALGLAPGDTLPADTLARARIAARLTRVPGVRRARLESVCCVDGRQLLYVGVEEDGGAPAVFRPAPRGRVGIADTLRLLSAAFDSLLFEAVRAGEADDDLSQGHSLVAFAPARRIQEQLLVYTRTHEAELRRVLRESGDGASRAIAAWALGYAADKRVILEDLVDAMGDPDPEVRNNATRAVAAIGALAARRPELGVRVPAAPFVRLLDSPVWTDRNKASFALMELTADRDPALLQPLRREALVPLLEIARWQDPGHAMAGYFVVARMAGVSDSAAFAAFQAGDRERVLGRVVP